MLNSAGILVVACALVAATHALTRDSKIDLEDANLDVPELITKYGYPVEVHDLVTPDGYILQMHRIPRGRDNFNTPGPRPAVFLMHGLISSSADYVIMGPGRALGKLDCCYPVEVHDLVTPDGYILQMHRIPRGRDNFNTPGPRPAVFLMHGLISSSADYVIMGPGRALGKLDCCYPVEVHDLVTPDGYILQMHRIPRGRDNFNTPGPRPAVFLMHGLISSSADYVIMGPGRALGKLDCCYPVEVHDLVTPDGYILQMHRIPRGRDNFNTPGPRPAVFLMHGLISSSADYVIMGPGRALGKLDCCYPVEVHDLVTPDGYILQMHRIPRGRDNFNTPGPRPAVFLMHGLISSSADYVIMGPGRALGKLDCCYPVEVHDLVTPDGYILQMHRIPRGRDNFNTPGPRPAVFLMHGLISSSADYVIMGPGRALGKLDCCYPVEVHDLVTPDGYILQMHRIPRGRDNFNTPGPRPAVFLMHGLISSSADYVIMGPGRALGYILAEEGFDVWMGNARGNYYSRRHRSLNPDSGSNFWIFSWEEIGHLDLAASIDYVLTFTGLENVHYIGHSQGTTSFLVLCALEPQYNAKFNTVHLLAPVAFLNHMDSPFLSTISDYTNFLGTFATATGLNELFPRGSTFEYVDGEVRCIQSNSLSALCEQFSEAFTAQSLDQFDREMLPVIIGHTPAGSALKQFAHYGQVISSHQFRRWRFTTPIQNLAAYGRITPPTYNLAAVTANVKLHYSLGDPLTPEADVISLHEALSHSTLYKVPADTFSHFDFAWGRYAREHVYDGIVHTMQEAAP